MLLWIGYLQGIPLIVLSGFLLILLLAYQPIQKDLIADATPKHRRGISYGVINGVLFGFGSLASLIGGWLIDRFAVNFIYIMMSGVAALAACTVGAQLILRNKRAKEVFDEPDLSPA